MPVAIKAKNNWSMAVNTAATGAADVYTAIPGIRSISGGGNNTDRIDVTAFDSPGNSKEYLGGLSEPQPRSFSMNYIPGNAVQQVMRAANAAGAAVDFKITLSAEHGSGETGTFNALVTKYGDPEGDPSKELTISFELTPTGLTTWAAGQ